MTAQMGEILIYQGKEYSMCSEPLQDSFEILGAKPEFAWPSTALWRGYVGTWIIEDEQLWLRGIEATLENGEAFTLKTLFPDSSGDVLADWYSGTLRVPDGELLGYIHDGFASTFERDILITIEQGKVTNTEVQENGKGTRRKGLEGLAAAAMNHFKTKP